jgi:GNAT superfamily N-acetyltransferase
MAGSTVPSDTGGVQTPEFVIYTLDRRPDLIGPANALMPKAWPRFMLKDAVAAATWSELTRQFAPFQFVVCMAGESLIAAGNTIPLTWDGTLDGLPNGWDAALVRGVTDRAAGRIPTTLSALAATIVPAYQGRGLSRLMISAMRDLAARHGFADLIAPVRPSLKSLYPLIPIERYIEWRQGTPDGAPFDPWLRTLGAHVLRVAPVSMVISGTVAEWEDWTEMHFPESGRYVVPGALEPITIDLEHDLGRYIEPNVWMRHRAQPSSGPTAD